MNKSKSIVKQASILALAGILVRIIGVLYRSPLTALIGDEGNGYYSTAYNIYAMVLLISSYSIPTAISKLISEKLALRQYNCCRRWICCLAYIYLSALDRDRECGIRIKNFMSYYFLIWFSRCIKRLFPSLFYNCLYISLSDY